MQLLPATFRALEMDLGFSPFLLGQMSLAQSLFQAAASPLWGVLADWGSRKQLLVISCFAWGVFTLALSTASTAKTLIGLRCLHGSTLASLGPIAQSIVADVTEPHERGTVYGLVSFAISAGQICASIVGTCLAERTFFSVVRGWRLVFAAVALISWMSAVMIQILMEEIPTSIPRHTGPTPMEVPPNQQPRFFRRFGSACGGELGRAVGLFRIPTFSAIVLQGIFGAVPWNAMGFMTMYLQYCGHSNSMAAFVASGILVGRAVGSIIGGYAGDVLAQLSEAHGRPCLAQISVIGGIPLVIALVRAAPHLTPQVLMLISVSLGLVASWCGPGVNRPILAEIVDPRGRASIIAWLVAIEGSSAALFGAPVVGVLAETLFGYRKASPTASLSLAADVRENNRRALGQSMLWGTMSPWLLCAAFYTIVHFTYAQDARRARQRHKLVLVECVEAGNDVEASEFHNFADKGDEEVETTERAALVERARRSP